MSGQIQRRYFEEKAKRLGLRVYTNPDRIWMRPYTRERGKEEEHERAGDYRLLAIMQKQIFQQDV